MRTARMLLSPVLRRHSRLPKGRYSARSAMLENRLAVAPLTPQTALECVCILFPYVDSPLVKSHLFAIVDGNAALLDPVVCTGLMQCLANPQGVSTVGLNALHIGCAPTTVSSLEALEEGCRWCTLETIAVQLSPLAKTLLYSVVLTLQLLLATGIPSENHHNGITDSCTSVDIETQAVLHYPNRCLVRMCATLAEFIPTSGISKWTTLERYSVRRVITPILKLVLSGPQAIDERIDGSGIKQKSCASTLLRCARTRHALEELVMWSELELRVLFQLPQSTQSAVSLHCRTALWRYTEAVRACADISYTTNSFFFCTEDAIAVTQLLEGLCFFVCRIPLYVADSDDSTNGDPLIVLVECAIHLIARVEQRGSNLSRVAFTIAHHVVLRWSADVLSTSDYTTTAANSSENIKGVCRQRVLLRLARQLVDSFLHSDASSFAGCTSAVPLDEMADEHLWMLQVDVLDTLWRACGSRADDGDYAPARLALLKQAVSRLFWSCYSGDCSSSAPRSNHGKKNCFSLAVARVHCDTTSTGLTIAFLTSLTREWLAWVPGFTSKQAADLAEHVARHHARYHRGGGETVFSGVMEDQTKASFLSLGKADATDAAAASASFHGQRDEIESQKWMSSALGTSWARSLAPTPSVDPLDVLMAMSELAQCNTCSGSLTAPGDTSPLPPALLWTTASVVHRVRRLCFYCLFHLPDCSDHIGRCYRLPKSFTVPHQASRFANGSYVKEDVRKNLYLPAFISCYARYSGLCHCPLLGVVDESDVSEPLTTDCSATNATTCGTRFDEGNGRLFSPVASWCFPDDVAAVSLHQLALASIMPTLETELHAMKNMFSIHLVEACNEIGVHPRCLSALTPLSPSSLSPRCCSGEHVGGAIMYQPRLQLLCVGGVPVAPGLGKAAVSCLLRRASRIAYPHVGCVIEANPLVQLLLPSQYQTLVPSTTIEEVMMHWEREYGIQLLVFLLAMNFSASTTLALTAQLERQQHRKYLLSRVPRLCVCYRTVYNGSSLRYSGISRLNSADLPQLLPTYAAWDAAALWKCMCTLFEATCLVLERSSATSALPSKDEEKRRGEDESTWGTLKDTRSRYERLQTLTLEVLGKEHGEVHITTTAASIREWMAHYGAEARIALFSPLQSQQVLQALFQVPTAAFCSGALKTLGAMWTLWRTTFSDFCGRALCCVGELPCAAACERLDELQVWWLLLVAAERMQSLLLEVLERDAKEEEIWRVASFGSAMPLLRVSALEKLAAEADVFGNDSVTEKAGIADHSDCRTSHGEFSPESISMFVLLLDKCQNASDALRANARISLNDTQAAELEKMRLISQRLASAVPSL